MSIYDVVAKHLTVEHFEQTARVERVRGLHYAADNDATRTPACETCHGKAGVHECGCWASEDRQPVCGHCNGGGKGVSVAWPCPTLRILDGGADESTYIAAASPDVVLSLLDRLAHMTEARDNARAEVERLAAAVRRVRELHRESHGSLSALYPNPICECGKDYPCQTARALAEDPQVTNRNTT